MAGRRVGHRQTARRPAARHKIQLDVTYAAWRCDVDSSSSASGRRHRETRRRNRSDISVRTLADRTTPWAGERLVP